jgi:hypothetical protein
MYTRLATPDTPSIKHTSSNKTLYSDTLHCASDAQHTTRYNTLSASRSTRPDLHGCQVLLQHRALRVLLLPQRRDVHLLLTQLAGLGLGAGRTRGGRPSGTRRLGGG